MGCYCDWDPPSVYHRAVPRARLTHRCAECRAEIRPGERYERVHGIWDGAPSHFRTCSRCLALRAWVVAHAPCVCWQHGHTREDCLETAREYATEAPGLLCGALRREILIRRNRRCQIP